MLQLLLCVLLLVVAVAYGFLLGLDYMSARVKALEDELDLFQLVDDELPAHVRFADDVQ